MWLCRRSPWLITTTWQNLEMSMFAISIDPTTTKLSCNILYGGSHPFSSAQVICKFLLIILMVLILSSNWLFSLKCFAAKRLVKVKLAIYWNKCCPYAKRLIFFIPHLRHKKFWTLGIIYAVSSGVFNCWSSVLDVNLKPIGISQVSGNDYGLQYKLYMYMINTGWLKWSWTVLFGCDDALWI